MEFHFIHLYPDLMSLYGSYANVSVLTRQLELLGHSVRLETVVPGERADLSGADFLFLGAGTERSQAAALEALLPMAPDGTASAAKPWKLPPLPASRETSASWGTCTAPRTSMTRR